MALVGGDFGKRHSRAGGIERMDDGAGFGGRKQPIADERNDAEARRRAAKRFRYHSVIVAGEIEVIHRPGQIEIGVGVETVCALTNSVWILTTSSKFLAWLSFCTKESGADSFNEHAKELGEIYTKVATAATKTPFGMST